MHWRPRKKLAAQLKTVWRPVTMRIFYHTLVTKRPNYPELYDQSYIVIMSDHGTSFDPLKPGRHLELEQVARVPFLIKAPEQTRGVVNPRPVHTAGFFEILLDQMEGVKHHKSLQPE